VPQAHGLLDTDPFFKFSDSNNPRCCFAAVTIASVSSILKKIEEATQYPSSKEITFSRY
jgi:hypothetical protein